MAKKVYLVENLDCANCAAKVEAALNALPEVQEAVLTYATMQLRITAEDPDALLPKLQEVAQKVEPGVEFYPRDGVHSHGGEHEHHHDHDVSGVRQRIDEFDHVAVAPIGLHHSAGLGSRPARRIERRLVLLSGS